MIDKRIIDFIKEHHILTLATANKNQPYTSTCFYVYVEEKNLFIFTSDYDTKHIKDIENNKNVALAIALETKITGKIRGLQITGTIKELTHNEYTKARKIYISQFPIAILTKSPLWAVEPDFIKMTDNRLGFGKKIIWYK